GLGQAVANLLEPSGEPGIIEYEADVVLDHAQTLTRTIRRGIEDAGQLDAFAGLGKLESDAFGRRQRGRVDRDLMRQPFAERSEFQAGRTEESRGSARGRKQAGEQVLGTPLPLAMEPAGLQGRLAQDEPQRRRGRQWLGERLVRSMFKLVLMPRQFPDD